MNTEKSYYGIEFIGYGKRRRYAVKKVFPGIGTNPVGYCKVYKTLEAARKAAADYGLTVEREGDFYELISG